MDTFLHTFVAMYKRKAAMRKQIWQLQMAHCGHDPHHMAATKANDTTDAVAKQLPDALLTMSDLARGQQDENAVYSAHSRVLFIATCLKLEAEAIIASWTEQRTRPSSSPHDASTLGPLKQSKPSASISTVDARSIAQYPPAHNTAQHSIITGEYKHKHA